MLSTIFKQGKILYKSVHFSEDERQNIKSMIRNNAYSHLGILLEGHERFEDESLTEMRKKQSSDQSSPLGNLEAIFPADTHEYAPFVVELWNNAAIQATYTRRNELEMLPSVASYYLEQLIDIMRADFEPSHVDILYARGITVSLHPMGLLAWTSHFLSQHMMAAFLLLTSTIPCKGTN
ncbi:hypothetical protein HHK36_003133 [Tetracentron sinense]|uniref:Uncharacterized protein n=1 Tax=Tetracentron sinense TaxID=13715 RepID=A0A834ZX31_TETSI|nr:hypothetical protein HHK36_003133 [Tetracentron sinense]